MITYLSATITVAINHYINRDIVRWEGMGFSGHRRWNALEAPLCFTSVGNMNSSAFLLWIIIHFYGPCLKDERIMIFEFRLLF
jgi:hypothetical protein